MKEEITFYINEEIFKAAEQYALENNTTVSEIVIDYLKTIALKVKQ